MSTTAKSNATTRRKPTQSAQERPAAQVVQFPLFAPKPRQTAPQEIQVVICECGADAVRVRLLPDPAAVLHPSPDEVQDTFTAPLSWLAAHGTAVVVCDPHELANVLGLDGIRWLLETTRDLPLDIRCMMPSCVPA